MLKLITKQSKVKPAIERFLKVFPQYHKQFGSGGGYWSQERFDAINALNPETATPADIERTMNSSWSENRCDECQKDFDTLVQIGQEPDYDARWLCLCGGCLHRSMEMLADTWRG
jgi:hypothetical protein